MKSFDVIDPLHHLPYAAVYPRQYVALRAPPSPPSSSSSDECGTTIAIDGDLDKEFWNEVDWTMDFVDIATETSPYLRTRAKIRWDDDFLYVGTSLPCEGQDVWISRDAVGFFLFGLFPPPSTYPYPHRIALRYSFDSDYSHHRTQAHTW
jgi:hypothetical protein